MSEHARRLAVAMTSDQLKTQTDKLTDYARSRYQELKGICPVPMSEAQFVAAYVVAHRDVMVTMAKATADLEKRRIYTPI